MAASGIYRNGYVYNDIFEGYVYKCVKLWLLFYQKMI